MKRLYIFLMLEHFVEFHCSTIKPGSFLEIITKCRLTWVSSVIVVLAGMIPAEGAAAAAADAVLRCLLRVIGCQMRTPQR